MGLVAGSFAGIFKMAVRFYNELNTKYCRFLHKINQELRLENIMK